MVHIILIIFYYYYYIVSIDLIAIPDFVSGAMENWGLITFRETRLLCDQHHSSIATLLSIALTIAHEISHMWFGDLGKFHSFELY